MPFVLDQTTYFALADANAWFADRPSQATPWGPLSDAAKQEALMQATEYIESMCAGRWKGRPKSINQTLAWPREEVFDADGKAMAEKPQPLLDALCWLALQSLNGHLLPNQTNLGVKAETLGPLKTEYGDQGPQPTHYAYAQARLDLLLQPQSNRLRRVMP